MEKTFQIAAVIFIGIAAYFLWRSNADGVFVSAALGAVCFFLSIRFQVAERMKERENSKAKTSENREEEEFKHDEQDI